MQDSYVKLTYLHVALAALLILINGAISLSLRLGLERRLLVAAVRTVVQLLLVGLLLGWVFKLKEPAVVLSIGLVMAIVAGASAVGRVQRKPKGIWLDTFLSMWASSWFITAFALLFVVVGKHPWYDPQYAIPILGMILGNTLNGVSLGLDRFYEEVHGNRARIEAMLTLGASRWEAARDSLRQAVRTGMIPIINSMSIVGIVSLPGMMTGQLISGALPMDAVKYQIVIMFLIAAGTALGTIGVVLLAYRRTFNRRHQMRVD